MMRKACSAFSTNFIKKDPHTVLSLSSQNAFGKNASGCTSLLEHFLSTKSNPWKKKIQMNLDSAYGSAPKEIQRKNVNSVFSSLHQQWLPLTEIIPNFNNGSIHDLNIEPSKMITNLLICGDGDLSFSASVTSQLQELGFDHIDVTATVLEAEQVHNEVYSFSKVNTEKISSFHGRHNVIFGIDATKLKDHFEFSVFDRIQFNFPHWKGKCNNRYNRELLYNFLTSASDILAPNGEIHVALCEGQGGTSSTSLKEWRQSWMAAEFAAKCDLLLIDVSPFTVQYNLSSHRGVDRGFRIGSNPELYKFIKPSNRDGKIKVPLENQLCCRHELHVVLPSKNSGYPNEDIIYADDVNKIRNLIVTTMQDILPDGIRVEIPTYDVIETVNDANKCKMVVFLVVYCGETIPITRENADKYREMTESTVSSMLPLRSNRLGRLVSKPFPYRLLAIFMSEYGK